MTDIAKYPHRGGCPCCEARKVCNACGKPVRRAQDLRDRGCTNHRCMDCHGRHCTPGGATSPGHGFGTIGQTTLKEIAAEIAAVDSGGGPAVPTA